MATHPDATKSYFKRATTLIVAIAAITAGVSVFLLNVDSIKNTISKWFSQDPVELSIRNAKIGPKSGTSWSDAVEGSRGFDIVFILDKIGTGSADQCLGELSIKTEDGSQSVYGGLTSHQQETINENPKEFEIKGNFRNQEMSILFFLPEPFFANEGDFSITCAGAGIVTNVLPVELGLSN